MAEPAVSTSIEPIWVRDVFWKHQRFRFRSPYRIEPVYDAEVGMLFVEIPELGIMSWGKTEQELLDDFSEDVFMTWKLYAIADDDVLAPDALKIKWVFHSLIQE